jgi:hypothetical protein
MRNLEAHVLVATYVYRDLLVQGIVAHCEGQRGVYTLWSRGVIGNRIWFMLRFHWLDNLEG